MAVDYEALRRQGIYDDGYDYSYIPDPSQQSDLQPTLANGPGTGSTQATRYDPYIPPPVAAPYDPLQEYLDLARRTRDENIGFVNDYAGWAMPAWDAAAGDSAATRNGISNQQRNANLGYNVDDQETLGRLGTAFGQTQRADQASLGNLQNLYNSLQPVSLAGFQGVGPSQAAGAYADPGSIAAQNQALSQLFAAAGGSLNVTSQGAQAYADPATIEGQRRALAAFQNMAGGGLDLESLAAGAHADPESIEAQKYALNKYKGLSDPTVTAEERFIMELARRNEEQDRKAALDAGLRDLEARGVRGSGAEVGAMLGAQQQTSQNRLLQDLGAEANAVQRSQQALAGYTGLANNIRGQSFSEDFNTKAAGDAMNVSNRDVRIRGIEDDASLNTTMRNQSFSEAYSRGTAADNVNTANANRQLSASSAAGGLASDMRNSSFSEEFNRGQAADLTARFNQTQLQQDNQFRAQFGLQQNNDIWGRGNDLTRTQLDASRTQDQRSGMLADAGFGATNAASNRSNAYLDSLRGDSDSLLQTGIGRIGLGGQIVGLKTGVNTSGFETLGAGLKMQEARNATQRALDATKKKPRDLLTKILDPAGIIAKESLFS